MNPLHHLITFHTTDERNRLWATCACGWKSGERIVKTDDEARPIYRELVKQARAHYDAI